MEIASQNIFSRFQIFLSFFLSFISFSFIIVSKMWFLEYIGDHLFLSFASSSWIPNLIMSFLVTSLHLNFGLLTFLFPPTPSEYLVCITW